MMNCRMMNCQMVIPFVLLMLVLCVVTVCWISSVAAVPLCAQGTVKFERLSQRQGLSQGTVQCILQDSRGFMWFGTQNGLNRWDGHTMKTFTATPGSKVALLSDNINALYEDKTGTLWVGTQSGLYALNRATEEFVQFESDTKNASALSNKIVNAITEDKAGNIWIGTYGGGLNKFQRSAPGSTSGVFVQYRANPRDPNAISSNLVWRLLTDKVTGELWVACNGGGLHRYQPEKNSFAAYFSDSTAKNSIAVNGFPLRAHTIEAIAQAQSSQLWIGRDGDGAGVERFIYQPFSKVGRFLPLDSVVQQQNVLPTKVIRSLHEDKSGKLWIGTEGKGLFCIDLRTGKTTVYRHNPNDPYSIADNTVLSIYEDNAGTLWFGTEQGGVSYMNPKARKFALFAGSEVADPARRTLLGKNVWAIYEDRAGTVWVGTDKGLNRLDSPVFADEPRFTAFIHNPEDPTTLGEEMVTAICESRFGALAGTLWVGTNGGGLSRFQRSAVSGLGSFRSYTPNEDNPRSISNEFIQAILEDRSGTLWVGTTKGLNRLDRINDDGEAEFTVFAGDTEDSKGTSKGLSNTVVMSLYEDRNGTLWIGTVDGLNRYERTTNTFTIFRASQAVAKQVRSRNAAPAKLTSLSNSSILSMYEDRKGRFWIGTQGGGLNLFDRSTGTFTVYSSKNTGLPNDVIYGILEDRKGHLWLSTNKGLCRFNPDNGAVRVYDERDGLQADAFNNGAYWKGASGVFFFGGGEGFNAFYPDSIRDNTTIPQLVFTDFITYNPRKGEFTSVASDTAISEQRVIEVPYREHFTIEFAALSFLYTDKNRYRYKLEGYEETWIDAGNRHSVTYTNIDPGTYTFIVQGSNYDGVWNEAGIKLIVVVRPPFYRTWWFYVVAVLTIVGSTFGVYRWRVRAIEEQKRQLEALVAERTKELEASNEELSHANQEIQRQVQLLDQQSREIELTNTVLSERNSQLEVTLHELKATQGQLVQSEKMASLGQLLAGVAHEVNNPVNFIAGAVKPLRRNIDKVKEVVRAFMAVPHTTLNSETAESVRLQLAAVHEQCDDEQVPERIAQIDDLISSIGDGAQRIDEIVKVLGNFSRADAAEMQQSNLHDGLDSTLKLLFNQYKNRVRIVKDYGDIPQVECYAGQLNQVFMNILANAIQAIPESRTDGEVHISTRQVDNNVVVTIKDNGSGMPDDVKKRIFDPFFTTKDVGKGTGLGLSISYSIIEKHRGFITVESQPGQGSQFSIVLPIQQPSAAPAASNDIQELASFVGVPPRGA